MLCEYILLAVFAIMHLSKVRPALFCKGRDTRLSGQQAPGLRFSKSRHSLRLRDVADLTAARRYWQAQLEIHPPTARVAGLSLTVTSEFEIVH